MYFDLPGKTHTQAPLPDLSGYPRLLEHILSGRDYDPLLKSSEIDIYREEWRQLMRELVACPPKDADIRAAFHNKWHVSHARIRALVGEDNLLVDALWIWLPRYEGPDLMLYRGENIDRYESGVIGTAWSDQERTAEVFARAQNNDGKGGVLLQTIAPAESIIAGPSAHSEYLGEREFTVDPRRLGSVIEKDRFPPHSL